VRDAEKDLLYGFELDVDALLSSSDKNSDYANTRQTLNETLILHLLRAALCFTDHLTLAGSK
jgi:hypothetical protein